MTKEKSHLITQQLLGAVDWVLFAPSSVIKPEKGGDGKKTWAEKAREDLENLLLRKRTAFPEAARRGVEFEKTVYKYANAEEIPEKFSDKFKEVCKAVRGFQFFEKQGKEVIIDGRICYVYAKYDAIKFSVPGSYAVEIKDIKTTEHYKRDKYLNGNQHKMYCYISGAERFEYIIAEWANYPEINHIYREEYVVQSKDLLKQEMENKISECLNTIKDLNLWDYYRENFCLY